jgi:hypothetical protein
MPRLVCARDAVDASTTSKREATAKNNLGSLRMVPKTLA